MLTSPVAAAVPSIAAPEGSGAADRRRGWPATGDVTSGPAETARPATGATAMGTATTRLATTGTALTGPGVTGTGMRGTAATATGGCCAWPLPLDATCAREARRVFAGAAAGLGLTDGQLYDGMTMASELAANALHARDNVELGVGGLPFAGAPELWLYLRRAGRRWELACKVFDSLAGWHGPAPAPAQADETAVSGRGLQVVAGLSGGRWGHHLTRSRLGGWKVPGKAVWFALPVPGACVPGCLRRTRLAPRRAARTLEAMLTDRGLGPRLLRAEEPTAALSVLSIRPGLTVWCRDRVIWWQTGEGGYEQRVPTDLVDTAEKIICTCQEMEGAAPAA
jgi:hypothetical protein